MRAALYATVLAGCSVHVPTFTPDPGAVECVTESTAEAPYGGGAGTLADPYKLCSPDQLAALAARPQDFNAAFVVGRDLDFGGATFPGIGSMAAPFTGVFDGGARPISNVTISGTDYVGLFNATRGAYLESITLANITTQGLENVGSVIGVCERSQLRTLDVSIASVTGADSVGGLIGYIEECDVLNVTLTATVTGSAIGEGVGGVLGSSGHSTVMNLAATVDVNAPLGVGVGGFVGLDGWSPLIIQNATVTGTVVGNENVGGLVGMNAEGVHMYRSHFEGTVQGNQGVGGFAGANYDSPFHVYATSGVADVTGTVAVGGFSGRHWYRTNFYDSYFKGTLTGTGANQDSFGGFLGDVEYYGWIERSYVDVTIESQAMNAGGFIGKNSYWSSNAATYDIARSFSVANVKGGSNMPTVSLYVGANPDPNPLVGAGSYYWSGGTCTNTSGGGCGTGGNGLATIGPFQTQGGAPVSTWDFANVWQATPGGLPMLRLAQNAAPMATATCPAIAIAGLAYDCDPAVSDADLNEARIALLDKEHTCKWIVPDTIPDPTTGQYTAGLGGTPTIMDAANSTCTLAYSLSDGANIVPVPPLTIDVHLGVVVTPSNTGFAGHNFPSVPINTAGTTVSFTLSNRESTSVMISVTGLPGAGFRWSGASATYPGNNGNCGTTLGVNQDCTIEITFAPTMTGSVNQSLTIQFTGSRGTVSYPFRLYGYGT